MRGYLFGILLTLLAATPASAIGTRTALLNLQQECAAVGDIAYGVDQRWADCRVSRGRWVSTIELIDMYQAQYCLGDGKSERCDQRALLLFGNRAYTPVAELMFQRIDPGDVEYDDPQVVINEYGRILTLSARLPGGARSNHYFLWQSQHGKHEAHWVAIDTQAWQKDLARRLPAGLATSEIAWPDVDTMSAKARLVRDPQRPASAGVVQVELGVAKERFVVKKITVSETGE